jgi:hypothetical protein
MDGSDSRSRHLMRKVLMAAVLATAALGGTAACTSAPSAGAAGSSDDTTSVCSQAISYERTQTEVAKNKFLQVVGDLGAGDPTDAKQVETDIVGIAKDWQTKFTDLASKNVKPSVKTALNDWLTFLAGSLTTASSPSSVSAVQARLSTLDSELVTACR